MEIVRGMEHRLYMKRGEGEVGEMRLGDQIVGLIVELDRRNYLIRIIHLGRDRLQYRKPREMGKDHDQGQAHLHQQREKTNKSFEHQEDLM